MNCAIKLQINPVESQIRVPKFSQNKYHKFLITCNNNLNKMYPLFYHLNSCNNSRTNVSYILFCFYSFWAFNFRFILRFFCCLCSGPFHHHNLTNSLLISSGYKTYSSCQFYCSLSLLAGCDLNNP